ncbi:unnamed protein product [Cochlearia groenlandica]
MDSQAQLQRNHGHHHHQAEEPIRIHHPEEEEHHEKGPAKVLKKVKEKAKKIKKALTKHGHGHDDHDRQGHIPDDHDLDEENDDYVETGQQLHGGAQARGKAHILVKEEIVPPGTKAFPVVSTSHTKPSEPIRGVGPKASHGHKTFSPPARPSGILGKEDTRGATTLTPHNTPVSLLSKTEDVTRTSVLGEHGSRDHHRVDTERHRGLVEDVGAPLDLSGSLVGVSNYQSKVTNPTGNDNKFPAGNLGSDMQNQRDPERLDEMHQPNQSSYTDKITSMPSVVADKAVAAKNVVASKLGYGGEGGEVNRVGGDQNPSSAGGYGSKVADMVTPVYEMVKETGSSVMQKLPLPGSGGGSTETETGQGQDKGVSAKEYVSEKLSPGEEDKALSEVVTEKLHIGVGGEGEKKKKGTVTQSEEVEKRLGRFTDQGSEEAMKHGEKFAEEGEGGMVDKLREAVTTWISGTTGEVVEKSTESVQDCSQSLGSTVGNMGMSGSGADGAGQRSGGKSDSVPVQKRFQESGH